MEIKSAMLLPKADPDEDMEEDDGDPRSQLIRQLLNTKDSKMRQASLISKPDNSSIATGVRKPI